MVRSKNPLEVVLDLIVKDDFYISFHAVERMSERGITREDIREVARMAHDIHNTEPNKVKILGPDLDGNDITLIAAIENGVLIVTVF